MKQTKIGDSDDVLAPLPKIMRNYYAILADKFANQDSAGALRNLNVFVQNSYMNWTSWCRIYCVESIHQSIKNVSFYG